ncbi:unnamed protein product [Rhizoctonia solani]|uniref:Arrestin C-terminal-like domain-containing protein n=1 Tax=Rhizoctonia solani TaxID=456999 RepID=A0A8H2WCL6_9AGAM|nr:unnamed protein product [Rhizoctonia solani]
MSSGFKLMLRPPPHVEFLQGYPGIPGHAERKGAMVQGTLEVRGTVKAKWVRVELRKIEILPGGGQNNTFAETIGERPITLWNARDDEFAELSSNDFPFHIAVPETLPPSIALERGSAIKYELIASVQLKGKKSLFKRDPAPISTYSAPIVIEKFELLQAWPIYSQPQTRQSSAYGVTLVATFARVAFGPGDVVPVEAVLRADVPGDGAILRAYELTVRETLIFRSSPPQAPQHQHPHLHLHSQQPPRRTPAAQTRSNLIADQKVPVPVQIFPGTQHKCDLGCHIPLVQTNVSVRTARHIEVNYIVQVKAVLSTGSMVSVELPITITNWQHQASMDVVRRIGYCPELGGVSPAPAPQVGLFQATNAMGSNIASPVPPNGQNISHSNGPASTAGSHSIPERVSRRSTSDNNQGRSTYSSPPVGSPGRENIDELGYVPAGSQAQSQTVPNRRPGGGSSSGPSEPEDYFGQSGPLNNANPGTRPSTANRRSNQNRFTIVNADEPEGAKPLSAEEEKRLLKEKYEERDRRKSSRPVSAGGSGARPSTANSTHTNGGGRQNGTSAWLTAEEEKQRLYENARLVASKTQQSAGHQVDLGPSPGSSSSAQPSQSQSQGQWPTAEDEKRQLFDNARKAAQRTQSTAFEAGIPYAQDDKKGASKGGENFAGGWAFMAPKTEGSVPYPQEQQETPSPPAQSTQQQSQWISAADEKRMLFERARAAAQRTQAQATVPPEETSSNSISVPYAGSPEEPRVLSPVSMLSPGAGFAPGNGGFTPGNSGLVPAASPGLSGLTPAGNKSGAELYAAGLAAMGRQSIYPSTSPAPVQTTPSPQPSGVSTPPYGGSGSGSSVPYGVGPGSVPSYGVGSGSAPSYGASSGSTPPYVGGSTSTPPYGSGSTLSHTPSQSKRFPSAAEEKAALAYMVAKQRVEQARANESTAYGGGSSPGAYGGGHSPGAYGGGSSPGIYGSNSSLDPYGSNSSPGPSPTVPGYDAIYGNQTTPPTVYGQPPTSSPTRPLSVRRSPQPLTASPPAFTSDLPPGFTPNPVPAASALSALEEKARLRRQYEEQDAGASHLSPTSPPAGPPPSSPPPPAFSPSPPSGYGTSAHDEKERMRLMYAEQDAAVRTSERRATDESGKRAALPVPPPAPNGAPPPFAGGFINPATFKPLSAAEEKARLRAQYEAEASGAAVGGSSDEPPPPEYGLPPSRQATITSPPVRSATLTPSSFSDGGSNIGATIQRDPSISWGKRRATQTPAPVEEETRSMFVPPPPPPPLLPKPPASYIQETLEAHDALKSWNGSRPPSMDYEALASPTALVAPPIPPKPAD